MNPRSAVVPVVAGALAIVALVGGSSPAAHFEPETRARDLLASAHPTGVRPWVADTASAVSRLRGASVKADTAALTSSTCDDCLGESTALHVVYVPRAEHAALDNVATAWAQGCVGCGSSALSVQVVVLDSRSEAVPDNRALALNAACTSCRTSALAFQVVLVTDDVEPMSSAELSGLRAWFDEQAASLRASVRQPLPDPPPTSPEPTPTLTPEPTATATPTREATTLPSPEPTRPTSSARPTAPDPRRARRDAQSALNELEALLTSALHADTVSADVDLSR